MILSAISCANLGCRYTTANNQFIPPCRLHAPGDKSGQREMLDDTFWRPLEIVSSVSLSHLWGSSFRARRAENLNA